MTATTPQIGQEFYEMLRAREAQAREFGTRHLCAVHDTDSMLFWLAQAAAKARNARGRLQVHVAASASVNQSTIDRFESHIAWPRDADKVIGAYADDLDVRPLELWEQAVAMWREYVTTGELPADARETARPSASARTAASVSAQAQAAAERPDGSPATSSRTRRAQGAQGEAT